MVLGHFDVDPFKKHCLVNGVDEISLTLQIEHKICEFEAKRSMETPWLDGAGFLSRQGNGSGRIEAVPVRKQEGEFEISLVDW